MAWSHLAAKALVTAAIGATAFISSSSHQTPPTAPSSMEQFSQIPIPATDPRTFSDHLASLPNTANALLLSASGLPSLPSGQAYDLALSNALSGSKDRVHVWFYPINIQGAQPTGWSIMRTLSVPLNQWGIITLTPHNAVLGTLNPTYLNAHPKGLTASFSITLAYTLGAHPASLANFWYLSTATSEASPAPSLSACLSTDALTRVAIPTSDPLTFADQHQPTGSTATASPIQAAGLPSLPPGQAYDLALGFSFNAANQPDVMRVWLYPVHIDTGSPTGWAALKSMPVHPGQQGTTDISRAYLDPGNYWGDNPRPPKCAFTLSLHYALGAHPSNGFNSWYLASPEA